MYGVGKTNGQSLYEIINNALTDTNPEYPGYHRP